jgi:hypothetical protein
MNQRKYVVYVHTGKFTEATELFLFADSEQDAIDEVSRMVQMLGGDMSNAIKVTAALDD